MRLESKELAAVLAGLRMLQDNLARYGAPPAAMMAIYEDAGGGLSGAEIDTLCERLKAAPAPASSAEIEAAREQHGVKDGDVAIQIDDDAVTSPAEDGSGTWVSGWLWVPGGDEPRAAP